MTDTIVTLRFKPEQVARLDELKAKTESDDYADVFKNALRVYEWLIRETDEGKTFYTRDGDGKIKIIKLWE